MVKETKSNMAKERRRKIRYFRNHANRYGVYPTAPSNWDLDKIENLKQAAREVGSNNSPSSQISQSSHHSVATTLPYSTNNEGSHHSVATTLPYSTNNEGSHHSVGTIIPNISSLRTKSPVSLLNTVKTKSVRTRSKQSIKSHNINLGAIRRIKKRTIRRLKRILKKQKKSKKSKESKKQKRTKK